MIAGAEQCGIVVGEVRYRDDMSDSGIVRPAIARQDRPRRSLHPGQVDVFETSGEYLVGQLGCPMKVQDAPSTIHRRNHLTGDDPMRCRRPMMRSSMVATRPAHE